MVDKLFLCLVLAAASGVGFSDLPDELVTCIVRYLPLRSLADAACTQFARFCEGRQLSLNNEFSLKYVHEADFRKQVSTRCPGCVVRLNLGSEYHRYVIDTDFRANVDGLVEDPERQVWSDMTELSFFESDLDDISPVARLTSLRSLNLAFTQIRDISYLRFLTNLQSLDLSNTLLHDISVLGYLEKLQYLDLSFTRVDDISHLAQLTDLQDLNLSNTRVQNISHLRSLTNLQTLGLSNTLVQDTTELGALANLQWLNLSNTQVKDISQLGSLKKLHCVDLSFTPVQDTSHVVFLVLLFTVVAFIQLTGAGVY